MNVIQLLWVAKVLSQAYMVKRDTGFPASAMTAQAIIETGYGRCVPRDADTDKYSYNLFGIKGSGENGYVECWTREWHDGQYVMIRDRFRAYNNYDASFIDYVALIKNYPIYKEALKYLNNPKEYIRQIWRAGYATDPDYVIKVNSLIDQVNKIPVSLLGIL